MYFSAALIEPLRQMGPEETAGSRDEYLSICEAITQCHDTPSLGDLRVLYSIDSGKYNRLSHLLLVPCE